MRVGLKLETLSGFGDPQKGWKMGGKQGGADFGFVSSLIVYNFGLITI